MPQLKVLPAATNILRATTESLCSQMNLKGKESFQEEGPLEEGEASRGKVAVCLGGPWIILVQLGGVSEP